jgi:hypothetical protein
LIGQTMRAPRRPRTWRSYIPGLARLLYRNNRWVYLRLPTANSHDRTDDHARFCKISLFKPSCVPHAVQAMGRKGKAFGWLFQPEDRAKRRHGCHGEGPCKTTERNERGHDIC